VLARKTTKVSTLLYCRTCARLRPDLRHESDRAHDLDTFMLAKTSPTKQQATTMNILTLSHCKWSTSM
jgi:hypothetical protein